MPSDFIRSIFPRRLRCRHVEETVTGQAAGQAPEKATSCVLQDPPPPYAFDNHAKDGDKELPSESSSIRPTTNRVSTQPDTKLLPSVSVRSCPHGTSSFERIKRIVRLQNFKESYEALDALIPGPGHRDPFTLKFRLCKPDSGSDLGIMGWGKYVYDKYGTLVSERYKQVSGTGGGLVLRFQWTINFVKVPRKQRESREEVHRLLSRTRVEVCTHLMLSDPRIVAAAYRLLQPEDDDTDPIERWEAGCNKGRTTVACEVCATVAERYGYSTCVKVDTKRGLGRGEDPTDPVWLAQCGVQEDATIVA